MGSFRLFLAIAVVLSHAGVGLSWLYQGVSAVVSFFVISGYVTTALIEKHYPSLKQMPMFLLDRVMRLFPQYLFYLAVAISLLAVGVRIERQHLTLSFEGIVANVLMIPTNLYMVSDVLRAYNTPTWTLGLEFMFYLLAPVLVVKRWSNVAFVLSFGVFTCAYLGVINTDLFGYRLIPGTLFIFLCGSFMRPGATSFQRCLVVLAWLAAVAMLVYLRATQRFHVPYNMEMLVGIIVGLPAVALLSRFPYRKVDELFGNVSYGVYLNHMLLLWIFAHFGADPLSPRQVVLLVAIAFAWSWVTYLTIERPVLRMRHRIRRAAQASVEAGADSDRAVA